MSSSKTKIKEGDIDNSTTLNTENKQVTASEGSTALGQGASLTINSIDGQTINRGFDAIESIAGEQTKIVGNAFDFGQVAIESNQDTTESALAFGRDAISEVGSALSEANQILARSNETAQANLQRSVGVDESTIRSEGGKQDKILIGAALAAVVTLALLNKKGKS
jgi:hypothetical protein